MKENPCGVFDILLNEGISLQILCIELSYNEVYIQDFLLNNVNHVEATKLHFIQREWGQQL